ncbi:MAG: DsbA family protein [Patescibacteria group bacterium]
MFHDNKEVTLTFTLNKHFVIGLAIGLALGILGTLGYQRVSGGASGARTFATAPTPSANTGAPTPSAPSAPAKLSITDSDHIRGNKNAPVVMVEFSDLECPFCSRHHPTMQSIINKYGDKVAWVYKHYPLSFHPQAMPAALASECASEQGKFWEFTDAVFAEQPRLSEPNFIKEVAQKLKLNISKFDSCVSSQKYKDKIAAQQQEGTSNGVDGTPATFINGQLVSGAVPEANLTQLIDAALAGAK